MTVMSDIERSCRAVASPLSISRLRSSVASSETCISTSSFLTLSARSLVQQRVDVALGRNALLNSSEPTVIVAHTQHLGANAIELIIDASSYLLPRSSLLAVNSAKLVVQALGHCSELLARLPQGMAIAGGKSSALF